MKNIPNAQFIGYTDMYAKGIDSYSLEKIELHQNTFLIDTCADSYFTGKDGKFPHALTWLLEDLTNK